MFIASIASIDKTVFAKDKMAPLSILPLSHCYKALPTAVGRRAT